jgi:hypothetical protein
MRRVTGLVLSALGAFLIVLALLTRFVVVGEAVKYPLNEDTVTNLIAHNASYFSPQQVAEIKGATLEDTYTVEDNGTGSSSTAVWKEFSYVYDQTNDSTVNYSTQQLAFDRSNAQLVNCCGTFVGTDTHVPVTGLGYVWPFNAQKKTYQVFDTTVLKAFPAVYSGTATVDGISTYKYVETIPATQDGSVKLPGTLVGLTSSADVTLPEYYSSTTTEYVDPITGGPVRGTSQQYSYLENSSGTPVLTLVKANFVTTPASEASVASTIKHDDTDIDIIKNIVPLVTGIVGIIVLAIGLILAFTRRQEAEYYEDEPEEVSV